VTDRYEDEPSVAGTTASGINDRSFPRGGSTRSSWNPDDLTTMRPVGVSVHDDDDEDGDDDEEERGNGLLLDEQGYSDRPPRRQLACVPFVRKHPWVMLALLLVSVGFLSHMVFRGTLYDDYDFYDDDEYQNSNGNNNVEEEDDSVCSRSQVFSSNEGRSECEAYCNGYMCCFLETDDCDIGPQECNAFRVCQILVPLAEEDVAIGVLDDHQDSTNDSLDVPQDQDSTIEVVEAACAPGSVTTAEGFHECERHCEAYMCCFEEDDNCVDEKGPNVCANYKDCSILITFLLDDTNTGEDSINGDNGDYYLDEDPNNDHGGTMDEDGSDPTFACDPGSVVTPDGRQRCADHCSKIMCCFLDESDANNCREEMGDTMCDIYKECTIMLNFNDMDAEDPNNGGNQNDVDNGGNQNDNNGEGEGGNVCAPDQVQRRETRGPCNKYCENYMCCFEEDDNCVDELGPDVCDAHVKCQILIAFATGLELDNEMKDDGNNGDDTNNGGGGANDNFPKLRRLKATSSTPYL